VNYWFLSIFLIFLFFLNKIMVHVRRVESNYTQYPVVQINVPNESLITNYMNVCVHTVHK
jgi:hypothetical protein